MPKLGRIKQLLQEESVVLWPPRFSSFLGIFRIFFKVFKRHIFFHKDTIYLLEMPLVHQDLNNNMTVRWISGIDLLLPFARERQLKDEQWSRQSYVSELKDRFKKGDKCFALETDHKIVSVIFVTEKSCQINAVDYFLAIPEKTAGLYDVYTVPAYRRQGVYSKLFFLCVNACIEKGYERAWMWIMPHNQISLSVHNKLGMNHVIRSISLCQIFGIKWHIIKALNIPITGL